MAGGNGGLERIQFRDGDERVVAEIESIGGGGAMVRLFDEMTPDRAGIVRQALSEVEGREASSMLVDFGMVTMICSKVLQQLFSAAMSNQARGEPCKFWMVPGGRGTTVRTSLEVIGMGQFYETVETVEEVFAGASG